MGVDAILRETAGSREGWGSQGICCAWAKYNR
jgi:hypothetical protein